MAMQFTGMKGLVHLGDDRMGRAIRAELREWNPLPECDLVLETGEALIPTGKGSQTRCERLSRAEVARVLARTRARRDRYGVRVETTD